MEINAEFYKQALIILLVLGSIVTSLVVIGFIQFNILKSKFDLLDEETIKWLKDTCESKFEYVCLNWRPNREIQWFTVGKSYKNVNGKIKDDQGVEWTIKLYKVKSGVYQIQDYVFERRKVTKDGQV